MEKKSKKKNSKIFIILSAFIIIVATAGIYATTLLNESTEKSSEITWGDAPDFTLQTLDGETFTLSDHLGKVIVIDFMTSWCTWCKPQMDELVDVLYEKQGDIFIVSVDVELGETRNDLEGPFGDYLDKWTFVMDNYEENVGGRYQVSSIPQTLIIDKTGNIFYVHSGLTSKEKIIEEIQNADL